MAPIHLASGEPVNGEKGTPAVLSAKTTGDDKDN